MCSCGAGGKSPNPSAPHCWNEPNAMIEWVQWYWVMRSPSYNAVKTGEWHDSMLLESYFYFDKMYFISILWMILIRATWLVKVRDSATWTWAAALAETYELINPCRPVVFCAMTTIYQRITPTLEMGFHNKPHIFVIICHHINSRIMGK